MASISIDADAFGRRVDRLAKAWTEAKKNDRSVKKEGEEIVESNAFNGFSDSDALIFNVGKIAEDDPYPKGVALQYWLLGYEVPDCTMILNQSELIFVVSEKKASILSSLSSVKGTWFKSVRFITKSKTPESIEEAYKQAVTTIKSSFNGTKIGVFSKESYEGKSTALWDAAIKKENFQEVDISDDVFSVMGPKEESEIENIKVASNIAQTILKEFIVPEILSVLDNEKKVTHSRLSIKAEDVLSNEKVRDKIKLSKTYDYSLSDWIYNPIIQSGGKYDLKLQTESDNNPLQEGIIICSLGVRYKSYCGNISRTFIMNSTEDQETNYKFLNSLRNHVISKIHEGLKCSDIYDIAYKYVEENRSDLLPHFTKFAGWSMGISFAESGHKLTKKSTTSIVEKGSVINLSLGFSNLTAKNKSRDNYSLLISDTVVIGEETIVKNEDGTEKINNKVLTSFGSGFKDISWDANDDVDVDDKPKTTRGVAETKDRRSRDDKGKAKAIEKRNEHQRSLHEKLQKEGIQRFENGKGTLEEKATEFKKFESYKKDIQIPSNVKNLEIYLDKRQETVVLPIYGQAVPFHLNTLRNVTKSEETEYTFLRFNFITPNSGGVKEFGMPFENHNATFVKTLSFRSKDHRRFSEIEREINDLKKELVKKRLEDQEKADLVEQSKLIEVKGHRPFTLPDVFSRPSLDKQLSGDLSLHTNGLRYNLHQTNKYADILFNNIKHLIFQRCDNEMIVIIHFHLKNPVMIGSRKTKDVQFFREVTDAAIEETGRSKGRRYHGDDDELHLAQEQRRRRGQLNKEFRGFAEKIQDASRIPLEAPYRDLSFSGVYARQLSLIQPTNNCLIHLVDLPFLVVTMSEVEIAHFEGVQFGTKHFDLILVFKDYHKPVLHINTISSKSIEHVKDWLDSLDIPFSEGAAALSWAPIMKTITSDPKDFYEQGGWSFLFPEESDSDEEEQISEFEASEVESESESDYSEESESEVSTAEEESEVSDYADSDE